jgi:hypothetical protein
MGGRGRGTTWNMAKSGLFRRCSGPDGPNRLMEIAPCERGVVCRHDRQNIRVQTAIGSVKRARREQLAGSIAAVAIRWPILRRSKPPYSTDIDLPEA